MQKSVKRAVHSREKHECIMLNSNTTNIVTEIIKKCVSIIDNGYLVCGAPGDHLHQDHSHIEHTKVL